MMQKILRADSRVPQTEKNSINSWNLETITKQQEAHGASAAVNLPQKISKLTI